MTKKPLAHIVINLAYQVIEPIRRAYRWVVRPFSVGVRGMVVDGEGRVLLVRHSYLPGWYMPGGGVKRRETVLAGLKRELFEEVGVTSVEAPVLLGVYSNFIGYRSDHVCVFVVRLYALEERHSHEIAEWGFFSRDELPESIGVGTKHRLAEYFDEAPKSFEW